MIAEPTEKINGRHAGHNLQKVRVCLGVKQEALALDLGISQQEVSKIESQAEREEGLLSRIADVLGVYSDRFGKHARSNKASCFKNGADRKN